MPINTSYDEIRGIFILEGNDELTSEEILRSALNLQYHPKFKPGVARLWDFRMADLRSLEFDDIINHRASIVTSRDQGEIYYRGAFVTDGGLTYSILQTYKVVTQDAKREMEVFKDLNEALEWLTEK